MLTTEQTLKSVLEEQNEFKEFVEVRLTQRNISRDGGIMLTDIQKQFPKALQNLFSNVYSLITCCTSVQGNKFSVAPQEDLKTLLSCGIQVRADMKYVYIEERA